MSYKTELMEEILTSKEAKTIIDYVTPKYGEAYVCLWLFQVIGSVLDELDTFPDEYRNQVSPITATWSIEFWEKEYGVVPSPDWTLEQRRKNLVNKIRYRAPMNPAKISEIVSNILGIETEIKENVSKNTFEVLVRGYTEDLDLAKPAIDEAKPAHLIYNIRVAELVKGYLSLYYGFYASEQETFKVEVK